MNLFRVVSIGTLVLMMLMMSVRSLANQADFDRQKFIDIASLKCASEIETARVALEKTSSPDVKAYAQRMIVDYTTTLSGLYKLAQVSNLKIFSNVELHNKAHAYVFERTGSTFDTAYASMRVIERRKTVNLFREAAASDDPFVKDYAETTLPLLMHHLYMAQQLTDELEANKAPMLVSNP